MTKGRLEAFSVPHGGSLSSLRPLLPTLLLLSAIAYTILVRTILGAEGPHSKLAAAIGSDLKGKVSGVLYLCAIPLADVWCWLSLGIYVLVAAIWLVPDRRMTRTQA